MDENVVVTEFSYMSADKVTEIHAIKWAPSDRIVGIIQIAHGMQEHIGRYREFAEFMASKKFVVCANDHIGYGKSISSDEKQESFTKTNKWETMVDDMHTLALKIKEEYGKDIPYILIGHSMGSFLARYYVTQYKEDAMAAIFTGTSSGSAFINFAISFLQKQVEEKGASTHAEKLKDYILKKYNRKAFPRHGKYSWLSRDLTQIDEFENDKLCRFSFTYGNLLELLKSVKAVSGTKWAMEVPANLNIYIFSGNMDPVGNYAHGVVKVTDWLVSTGHQNVLTKFYEDARHEMLHETNRNQVFKDLLKWVNKVIKKGMEEESEDLKK